MIKLIAYNTFQRKKLKRGGLTEAVADANSFAGRRGVRAATLKTVAAAAAKPHARRVGL